jgi:methionyl-tRNA formyltransferase
MILKIVLLTIDRAGELLIERLLGILPENVKIELVVTRETRNYDFAGNPVVNICEKAGISYTQPSFKGKDYLDRIKEISPDLIIISNFHKIIKNDLIEIPKIGTFNLHSSLLPNLRGGTSIIWALKNGLKETGVTLHYVTEEVDDGDVVHQEKVPISFWDTQGSLYEKITFAKFEILNLFLKDILEGKEITSFVQNHKKATYLPKRKDDDGILDLKLDMLDIYNHIRSFDPWTGAYVEVNNVKIRLRNVIPVARKMHRKVNEKYIILSKPCESGIQSIIVQAVDDIIENPKSYKKELAELVLEYWNKNIKE